MTTKIPLRLLPEGDSMTGSQAQQLLLLRVELFLGEDVRVQQALELLQRLDSFRR